MKYQVKTQQMYREDARFCTYETWGEMKNVGYCRCRNCVLEFVNPHLNDLTRRNKTIKVHIVKLCNRFCKHCCTKYRRNVQGFTLKFNKSNDSSLFVTEIVYLMKGFLTTVKTFCRRFSRFGFVWCMAGFIRWNAVTIFFWRRSTSRCYRSFRKSFSDC